ncbi:SusC/RagA family TonB-linked outer membrane protein [Gelidibacter salicanalis]|uniref:SusC/RagA family TonB-linked outer membrane protein n=2 Tax=Gelidibacter salicanalis TaxID=291193 RepID=A0A934NIS0_9FLAO|nr:SusC/RagA family TonB-linked outer membrane protein [Gelidibacter salicanalis]
MSIYAFVLLLANSILATTISGQSLEKTKVSFSLENATVIQVFKIIENQTDFSFVYDNSVSDKIDKINFNYKLISLLTVLEILSKENHLGFKQINNSISVKTLPQIKKNAVETGVVTRDITGTITDSNGVPLPGVTVVLKGTNIGTSSDFDGNFYLSVVSNQPNMTLVFSFVGYVTKEVELGTSNSIKVILDVDVASLDEVIVVGYGTQKKENLTGAISQINADDIALRPVSDVSTSLQGLLPGLNIQVNNGDPSATPDINIRGFNSINGGGPLVLIDGIVGDITRVNPQDIQNVTVLKDAASAAIYGARGAFGVILITTKTGKSGDMRVDYSYNLGLTSPTTRTDFITNPYVYGKTVDAALNGYNGSNYTGYTSDMDWETIRMVADGEIEPFYQPQANGANKFFYKTDWYNHLFKKVQYSKIHNLSISGGSDKLKGYLSGRFYDRDNINNIQDTKLQRYNLKSTLTFKPTKWLELSNNILFNREKNQDFGGYRSGYGGIWSTTTWYDLMPFYPKEINGIPTEIGRGGGGGQGGTSAMADGNNWRKFNEEEFTNTFRAKLTPLKNLEVNFDYSNKITTNANTYRYNEFEYLTTDRLELQTGGINRLGEFRWRNYYNALNLFGSYKVSIKDVHNFKLLLGYNQEDYERDNVFAQQGGLLLRDKSNLAFGTEILNADGSAIAWAVQGYFGRFNYDYKSKYLLEVNARYDGSSRFPENSRWGFFPSVSAGWQVNKENFWEPVGNVVNALKLRVSFGELGNQSVGVNTFQQLMGMGQSSWLDNEQRLVYVSAPGPLPRVVSWETTRSLDFGVDLGLFKNKVNLTFDWFEKNTDGMYLPGTPLPAVFGSSEPRENLASLRNRGIELSMTYRNTFNVGGSPLSFSATANVTNFKGIITKYENPQGLMSTYWEGQELGTIYGYRTDGQFKSDQDALDYQNSFLSPTTNLGNVYNYILNIVQNNEWSRLREGDLKYLDTDGDGSIDRGNYTLDDPGDLRPIGNAMPKFPFGFNVSATWKGFDFSLAGSGVAKQNWYPTGDIYWGTYQRPYLSFLRKDLVNQAWTPGKGGEYPQIERGYASLGSGRSLYEMNDHYLKNIGYLRVKNLTLGFTIPRELTSKYSIQKLRLYFSGENLITWRFGDLTKYVDPEQAGSAINYSDPGNAVGRADLRSYPMGKTVSFGVNLSL